MANEPKSCIFCEATRKMSGEHVWGDWTKDFVERTSNKHNHANVFVPEPGEPEPALVRIRAGDPLDSKVHVVCEPCNNGWLSVIQNNAKDRLVPLFSGVPCILSVDDQTAIAMWVAMATMTGEYLSADRKRLAIPQSDRRRLMERKSVPSGCAVVLLIDFRLDELCQVSQRLLPTEIASLQRNGTWQAFLHNI
jgi:hypothetical protein